MGWEAPWHWVVLAIIVIALFGYKKMPDAARAMGRSLRIFKTEIKGMTDDDKARDQAREQAQIAPVVPEAVAPVATQPVPQAVPAQPPVQAQPAPAAPVSTPGVPPLSTPVATSNGTRAYDEI